MYMTHTHTHTQTSVCKRCQDDFPASSFLSLLSVVIIFSSFPVSLLVDGFLFCFPPRSEIFPSTDLLRVRQSLALSPASQKKRKTINALCSIENNPTQSICMRGECDNAGTSSVLSRISQIIPS